MPEHQKSISVAVDARYIRERPSGIGVYVQALVDRMPTFAPLDRFLFWAHRLAARPLSRASNTSEVTVRPGPSSPLTLFWPGRYASFDEVDVFHSPHNVLPRRIPCASVVTIHDVMSIEHPGLHLPRMERVFKSKYYQRAVWRALSEATRLITPSKATADRICALAPDAAKRVSVIWEAPDSCFQPPNDFETARKEAARFIGDESPYLLLVGVNIPTKRHDLAIAAFAKSVPRPWRLVLLQSRRSSNALVRLARRLQIVDRLVWLEARNREDVVKLIQGAGALVQPSDYEGFGLPVVEAMASGCPVVVSDLPVFREITGGAALLVPPDNVDLLAATLRDLVQSPELRRSLSEQGLSRSREFSWDRCARETLDVYHDAASCRR